MTDTTNKIEELVKKHDVDNWCVGKILVIDILKEAILAERERILSIIDKLEFLMSGDGYTLIDSNKLKEAINNPDKEQEEEA